MYKLTSQHAKLFDAVSDIDYKFIDEALVQNARNISQGLKRFIAIAAIMILLFTAPLILEQHLHPLTAMVLLEGSPFRTTVSAGGGYSQNLKDRIINYITRSSWEEFPRFGDHTTFLLSLNPTEWDREGSVAEEYYVILEYNGTPAGHPLYDEHVMLTETPNRFDILGWFDEPTDLVVTFVKRETNTVVQTQTIHIEYDKMTDSYSFSAKEVIDYTQGG